MVFFSSFFVELLLFEYFVELYADGEPDDVNAGDALNSPFVPFGLNELYDNDCGIIYIIYILYKYYNSIRIIL